VVCLDAEAERIAAHGPERAGVEVGPENLAYVIYTSGSTGRPKGTEVPHRAIPGFFWEVEYARFGAGQVVLQHSSASWDVLTLELWPALLTGGRCVLHPERTPDLPVLHDSIRRHGVNTLWLPAALFNLVVDTRPEALEGIRQLMTGGEAVSAAHARRALELYPGLRLVNGYGPSECTVFTNCHVVPRGFGGATVPIGAPVGDRRVYVLDRLLSPVPAGVPGELYVGGPSVARGYLGRAALTAERFVPDAFAGEPGARLYRTGDRVRWLGDGNVEFLGRADDQVKVRGFRVEPGEVEAALLAHPGVREAAVVLRAGSAGEQVLAAYAVPAPGARIAAEELWARLRERLPEFMVPSVVVTLEALPLTPNGKLDRRALPDPPAALPDAGSSPRDAVEELLAALWAEVLGAGPVGIHDDFFELGGHSLLAVQLAARVRAAFRRELPLRALFEAPTVARLAARLREGLPAERRAAPPLVPAARDPRRGLPLSFAQERLWFLEQMRPGTPLYNVPMGLWMRGTLDVSALRRALDELARRHESLRTVFRAPHGSPVQEVLPAAPVETCFLDLTRVAAGAREGAALRAAADGAERPFDLAAGPPLRASLLRVAPDEHLLVLVVHHVVSDLWSVGILFRELSALYGAGVRGEPSPLPGPRLQYADFAVWQREWLRGEALERQTAYWRGRLAGAPPLELPTDRPRPAVQGSGGAVHRFHVAAPLAAELRALAGREGATLFMVLLAAFDVLLSRYADQEDVLVGSPVSGRSHEELEGVVGFLTNTLVLRARLPRGLGFGGLLGQVRETLLDAYAHQDLPFEKLVEELGTDRSLDRSPLFQVLFTLQNAPGGPLSLAGLELEPVGLASGTSKFDLTFLAREAEGGVAVAVEYATALFDPATVGRMAEHFGVLLEGAAADPARPVHALPLMRPAEERRVVSEWNATGAAYPADLCVHHLLLERVRRTPEAVAVASRGERVTYAELDRRSGRLARYLGRLGVSADSRVGLCLERSPELVTAVLAVLKAGGAYVPLDPAYPAERLDAMVRDAGMRVLLTTSGLADSLPRTGARLVLLDAEREAIGRESPDGPAVPVHPDNLAYVIYTSGSTGRPKGVAMTHRPLVNLLAWQERDWRTGGPAATLQFATVSFDASFHEIFSCWASGGTLVLASEEERRDPAAVLALLEGEGVERFFLPYVALQGVADAADALRPAPRRLREVQTAGEQLRVTEPIRRWMGALRAPLHNHYGPSETHVVTSHTLEGDPASWPLLPPIGRPIANTRCYVLDGRLGPAPVGVPGELYVGGVSLARGYLELPGLTAERFLPDPFAADGTRMYRTGDRVRWLASGELDFLGRADQQVKIRGFRVECGEVEAALERHPAVREALVAAREDRPGDRRLVAYVVGAGAAPAAAELRAHARAVLPEHMVPSAFVVLERLPLASSGKIDRRHLPAPDPTPAEAYVPPGNDAERTVAEAWAEVLGITRVGVGANFFDLGGNSLLAVRVCHRLREALGREVPVVELFRHPTVRAFARALLPGGGRVRLDRVRARAGRAREALDRHGPADKRKGPAR
jgi:amino acid adenylation domain-containing protein